MGCGQKEASFYDHTILKVRGNADGMLLDADFRDFGASRRLFDVDLLNFIDAYVKNTNKCFDN